MEGEEYCLIFLVKIEDGIEPPTRGFSVDALTLSSLRGCNRLCNHAVGELFSGVANISEPGGPCALPGGLER